MILECEFNLIDPENLGFYEAVNDKVQQFTDIVTDINSDNLTEFTDLLKQASDVCIEAIHTNADKITELKPEIITIIHSTGEIVKSGMDVLVKLLSE